ncbi:MAG: phosphoglycerate dehydrogenase, partial [Peptostreptococcaceae bacterium]|nr:phosphoglycerate dehydrogenase [Peptostreptococcaceae bacterium]
MKAKKILITPRSISKNGHPELSLLTEAGYEVLLPFPGKQPSEEDLLSVIGECSGYLAGVEKISRKVLDNAPMLRIISRNGVGLDNVDLQSAKEHGIEVLGTPGANSQGVAELALTLLLGSARAVVEGS